MKAQDLSSGDFVEHYLAPHTIWEVRNVERYTSDGGQASLKWVGGAKITYALRQRICDVYVGGDVAHINNLRPANPMLVIALVSR